MNKYEIIVDKQKKISKVLYDFGLQPSQVNQIFKNKDIKVDGIRVSKDTLVEIGQEIVFYLNDMLKERFEIFYEDENVFIINKFEGIEVVGKEGIEGRLKGSIAVHRLDRDTKGLLVMAKNKLAEESLLQAFKDREITKKYLCEVQGDTNFKDKIYEAYLLKDSKNAKVKVYAESKPSTVKIQTRFTTVKKGNQTSVVDCELLTGKTHQIRAHLSFLGHPILGDNKYGDVNFNKKYKENKQKLHCYFLKFNRLRGILSYLNNKEFILYPQWFKKRI